MNKTLLVFTIISLLSLTSCTGIDTDLTYEQTNQPTETNSDPIQEIVDQVEGEKEINTPVKNNELPEEQSNITELKRDSIIPKNLIDTFKYDEEASTYYGNLIVAGYPTITEVQEPFCEENCDTHDYVYFNITSSDNIYLEEYLSRQTGNSFVGDMKIGIGCIENDIISRSNDSDEFGMQEYQNATEETKLIMSATKDTPITLQLERYLYTGGHGAPACYSHFAEIRPIN